MRLALMTITLAVPALAATIPVGPSLPLPLVWPFSPAHLPCG